MYVYMNEQLFHLENKREFITAKSAVIDLTTLFILCTPAYKINIVTNGKICSQYIHPCVVDNCYYSIHAVAASISNTIMNYCNFLPGVLTPSCELTSFNG